MKTLSIRQPWASLIISGHKPIENRTWKTSYRGPLLIHATRWKTQAEFEAIARFCTRLGVEVPPQEGLEHGGIIGTVDLTDIAQSSGNPWGIYGQYHWILENPKPLAFIPAKGKLGLWDFIGEIA